MIKHLFILTMALLMCVGSYAQQKRISGTVSDNSTGEVLIGVSVYEPGTSNGTTTDVNGNYSLNINGSQVSFSYVGYATKTLAVKASKVINIKLSSDTQLGEVIVVGYGTQRKSDLTGSVASINATQIKNQAVSNVSTLLAGKAAGVFVGADGGQPGASSVVRIRGYGTVNDNNPLYVVDGQYMDDLNNLNPADIERIEVLKDAASAAIYGSRGSNGVILITTKGGTKGKTEITFDGYVGAKSSYKAMEMMNSEQFYNFIMEAYKDDETFQASQKEKFTNQYKRGYDTDWWKEVTRTGFNQNYNLSIRKGSDKSRTALSLGYLNDQGAIIETYLKRYSVRFNQEYDLNSRITIGVNANIAKIDSKDSGLPAYSHIQKADPFTPVINPLVDPESENYKYNKYAPTEWAWEQNPVALINLSDRHNNAFNIFGNMFASVKLLDGLTYRFQYSLERNSSTYKNFSPAYQSTYSEYSLDPNMAAKYQEETRMTHNTWQTFNQTVENRLNYQKKIGLHHLDIMGAITYEKNDSEGVNAFKTGALSNDEIYHVLDAQTQNAQTSGGRTITSMMSYLGRISYNYADKYLATVNFRADGSSRFAKQNRWGCFPSFSLGWRITNEEFFKNLQIDNWVSSLKIRASWGQNGNQRIDNNARYSLVGNGRDDQWCFGSGFSLGYLPTNSGNTELKWETSEQTNVGLDAVLFNNTLEISMDLYEKKTKDMLLSVEMPAFGAFPTWPYFNAGSITNRGFELALNYRNNIGKDFEYNVGVNLSTYKTEVTELTSEYLQGQVSRTYVGGPIGRFYGHKQIGIFQNQEEIDNYVDSKGNKIQPNARPGDFKFAKLTEEGALNDDDRTFIGDPNPDLIYGFNLGFAYKNFDLSMVFQGTLGNDIYDGAIGQLAFAGSHNSLEEAYTKSWKQEGDHAKYPRISNTDSNNNYRLSSFMIENGSYLRLQNLQIGYNLPKSFCQKSKLFQNCRIYVSGQNLFTFTKYSGLDPDLGVSNPLDMGVDNVRYPTSRVLTLGVNVHF